MISKDTPVADLEQLLMGLEVPCGKCGEAGEVEEDFVGGVGAIYGQCPDCQGSGVRYPLRLWCPERLENMNQEWFLSGRCSVCGSTDSQHIGYIFNADFDALRQAVEDKGWAWVMGNCPPDVGTQVEISLPEDYRGHIAKCDATEGIVGIRAMWVCLARTMEATE